MIENITVVDKNGNGIFAEGISYFQFLSSGKKYILYTLNERVQNDRIKMYVAGLTDIVGSLEKIPDEEWQYLRGSLTDISHGKLVPDIKFLSMSNDTFNIGIPKKLAITAEDKRVFRDSQIKGVLANQQQQMQDTPVVDKPKVEFFYSEGNETQVLPTDSNQEQVSVFNPMKPELVSTLHPSVNINQGDVQEIESHGVVENPLPTSMSMTQATTMVSPTIVPPLEIGEEQNMYQGQNTSTQTIKVDNSLISNPIISKDSKTNNASTSFDTPNLDEFDHSIEFPKDLIDSSNYLGEIGNMAPADYDMQVTREEALKALETLNRYFNNTKELPSELAKELNGRAIERTTNKNEIIPSKTVIENQSSTIGLDFSNDNFQPEFVLQNDASSQDNSIALEKQRTLSLVPEGISTVLPFNANNDGYGEGTQSFQDVNYQTQNIAEQMLEAPTMEQNNQMFKGNQMQPGYVASNNGPAVDMSTPSTNISDVPVTLPVNYNPQAITRNNVVIGPGSLSAENLGKVA